MELIKNSQYPNLWDTNGRRSDWTQALDTYTKILDNQEDEWNNYPKSLTQYEFYKSALSMSEHVFKTHTPYDTFEAALDELGLRDDFEAMLLDPAVYKKEKWFNKLDNGIEDRARHYTSNLVTFGFASPDRIISPIGKQFIDKLEVRRDDIEQLLPFNKRNNILVLFRQALKLKVWKNDMWFSPAMLLLLMLCSLDNFDEQKASRMIECGFTLCQHNEMTIVIDLITDGKFDDAYEFALDRTFTHNIKVPENISDMDNKEYFALNAFANGKSIAQEKVYKKFVLLLEKFLAKPIEYSFKELMSFYHENKDTLKKRFGNGSSLFKVSGKNGKDFLSFLKVNQDNPLLDYSNIRHNVFVAAAKGANMDKIVENAQQIKKLFIMSDIVSTNNGQIGSDYSDIYKILNDYVDFSTLIYGNGDMKAYEGDINSPFYNVASLSDILQLDDEEIDAVKNRIISEIGNEEELKDKFIRQQNKRLTYLAEHIFTPARLIELLSMFYDRKNNDKKIIDAVGGDCDAPTALEYLCGMSMYHLLDGDFLLSKAFNMSLNGDGYPVRYAGGNQADIVIEQEDTIGIVELTLMDATAQEKGETVPVFKHTKQMKEAYPEHNHWTWFIALEVSDISEIIWNSLNKTEGTNIIPMTVQELVNKLKVIS